MTQTNKQRESQAELVRCISIMMILLHHFCIHGLYPEVYELDMFGYSWDSHLLLFLHSFFYIGVNCFILISGWYGIKTTFRGFLKLYMVYAFYMLLYAIKQGYFLYINNGELVNFTTIFYFLVDIVFPFSNGGLGFMVCYIGLFLIAPVLNAAICKFSYRQYLYALILLTIINVYFGDFWSISRLNHKGYDLSHFIYIYMIGGFLRNHLSQYELPKKRLILILTYVISGIIWGIFTMLEAYKGSTGFHVPNWHVFVYNNPLLIIMSISFFLFIMSWNFKSSIINKIAASSIGVYLLQEKVIQYDYIQPFAHQFRPLTMIGVWIGISIIFYCVAFLIDQARIACTSPIMKWYDKIANKYGNTSVTID